MLWEGGGGQRPHGRKPCQDGIGKIWVSLGWFVSCSSPLSVADGLNDEDGIGFLLEYASTGLLF